MQVKKEEIQEKILEVAKRLFIKQGYENTSLKQIADISNISKSNIYRYFSSKEEIYDVLISDARNEVIKISRIFFTKDFIEKDTLDKCDEISIVLAKLFSTYHSEILIMFKSTGVKDRRLLEDLIIKGFIEACPLKDEGVKELISKLMIFGLTDILLNHHDEESISKELNALICYHYLGLNGVKER